MLTEVEWRHWTGVWPGLSHSTIRPLEAPAALAALQTIGIRAELHPSSLPYKWRATCPACHRRRALRVAERYVVDDMDSVPAVSAVDGEYIWKRPPMPTVTIGCSERCCEPELLLAILSMPTPLLRALREMDAWRGKAHFMRRQIR